MNDTDVSGYTNFEALQPKSKARVEEDRDAEYGVYVL